jgi:hypothetical protein
MSLTAQISLNMCTAVIRTFNGQAEITKVFLYISANSSTPCLVVYTELRTPMIQYATLNIGLEIAIDECDLTSQNIKYIEHIATNTRLKYCTIYIVDINPIKQLLQRND